MTAGTQRFRADRERDWNRLEALLDRAEKKSVRALGDEDLMAIPTLYRGALSSLSVARETYLDLELVTYLEGLCARAYFFVYGVRASPSMRLRAFFVHDWPAAVRSLWLETLLATVLLLAGMISAYVLVARDPAWFGLLVPESMSQGRDFSASAVDLRHTLYDGGEGGFGVFAAALFTNNSQVAIGSFALGFAFGVPTALLLVYNGTIAGALIALFAFHDLGAELGGWLFIHGSTELFAIAIAGGAGLRIGWAIVFPGSLSRLHSATTAGKTAGTAMAGVIVMLLIAGLLEGYGRQLITPDIARYAVGAVMLAFWIGYFYAPRSRRDG